MAFPSPVKKVANVSYGYPMSGKGFIGRHMAKIWGFKNWVCRDEISRYRTDRPNSKFASLAIRHEEAGTLIPDEPIMSLFRSTFALSPLFNLDGIPRNPRQARELVVQLAAKEVRELTLIHLVMTPKESMDQFLKKKNASDRGNRLDAKEEIHAVRIALHQREQERTLAILKRNGVRVYEVPFAESAVSKLVRIQTYLHLPEIPDSYLTQVQLAEDRELEAENSMVMTA